MVTETNVNIDVTISSFECTDYGGYGNKKYSLEFVQYRSLKVYTTDELKIVKFVKKTVTRPAAAAPSNKGSYTVKSGDNLWKIARKFYGGSGSTWTKIYSANKSVIESTAKSTVMQIATMGIGFSLAQFLLFQIRRRTGE